MITWSRKIYPWFKYFIFSLARKQTPLLCKLRFIFYKKYQLFIDQLIEKLLKKKLRRSSNAKRLAVYSVSTLQ